MLSVTGRGGVILLITDGEENAAPYIDEVLPTVIQSGVRVVTIAFGLDTIPV